MRVLRSKVSPEGAPDANRAGALYVVGTPIGNASDLSIRAVQVLKEADVVACEDTSVTQALLARYGCAGTLTSYAGGDRWTKAAVLVQRMTEGAAVALVVDSGMPAICDPGAALIRLAREASIPVHVVPGPSAGISALALSGFPGDACFLVGMVPAQGAERERLVREIRASTRPTVVFARPRQVRPFLKALCGACGARDVFVVSNLTTVKERCCRGPLDDVLREIEKSPLSGAITIVVAGGDETGPPLRSKRRPGGLKGPRVSGSSRGKKSRQEFVPRPRARRL